MSQRKYFEDCDPEKNFIKEQLNNPGLGLRGAFGPVQFNDEYDDINVYRER